MKRKIHHVEGTAVEQDFDAFFREHSPLVYRTAHSVTRNREDAEDVAQTVFAKLLKRDCPGELAKNVQGYVYTTALNEALKMVQARQGQNMVGEKECLELVAGAGPGTPLPGDICERLWKSLERLGAEAAGIFLLRYREGYSNGEIATMLGLSQAKVAVTLYRSRNLLKRLMGGANSAAARAVARGGRKAPEKSPKSVTEF